MVQNIKCPQTEAGETTIQVTTLMRLGKQENLIIIFYLKKQLPYKKIGSSALLRVCSDKILKKKKIIKGRILLGIILNMKKKKKII